MDAGVREGMSTVGMSSAWMTMSIDDDDDDDNDDECHSRGPCESGWTVVDAIAEAWDSGGSCGRDC